MRGATQCAKRLKQFVASLRSKQGKLSPPPTTDPITQVLLGVLSRDMPESRARAALDGLRNLVVDYNELRVIPVFELTEMLGDYAAARTKAEDISRALNDIFARQHDVSLDHLREMNKRDVQQYLAEIDGLDPYTCARVRLLGLEQHAIPLDEAMWAAARAEEIVDAKCGLDEAQSFLERQIASDDALEFIAALHKHAWDKFADAVEAGEGERIRSTPIEHKTSHMLQDLSPAAPVDDLDAFPEDAVAAPVAEDAAAPKRARKTARKTSKPEATKKAAATTTKRSKAAKSGKTVKAAAKSSSATKTKAKKTKAAKKTAASKTKTARKTKRARSA